MIERPDPSESFAHFQGYVSQAIGTDLRTAFDLASERVHHFASTIAPEREGYRYAEGKWTINEVVQHLNDTERILSYRALRFARKDTTELPGFEENDYVPAATVGRRRLRDLVAEHDLIRASTLALFASFDDEMLFHSGVANGKRITVRALGWSIAGHVMHHVEILDQRYR